MISDDGTNNKEARRAFWSGFGRGLGESLVSPENLARSQANARLTSAASFVGSVSALSWVRHLRAGTGQPFNTSDQVAVVVTGAVGATVIALVARHLWRKVIAARV